MGHSYVEGLTSCGGRPTFYTEAFTHRRFYTQTLLHTEPFTHRGFYTQTLYTQTLLHTEPFAHRSFYTPKLLLLSSLLPQLCHNLFQRQWEQCDITPGPHAESLLLRFLQIYIPILRFQRKTHQTQHTGRRQHAFQVGNLFRCQHGLSEARPQVVR